MMLNVKMSYFHKQFNNAKLDGDVIPVTTTTTTPTPIPANSTGLTHYIEKNERQDSSSSLEVRTFLKRFVQFLFLHFYVKSNYRKLNSQSTSKLHLLTLPHKSNCLLSIPIQGYWGRLCLRLTSDLVGCSWYGAGGQPLHDRKLHRFIGFFPTETSSEGSRKTGRCQI